MWVEEEEHMGDILRRRIRGCTHPFGCFSGMWPSRWGVEGSKVGIQEHRTQGCKHYSGCFCDKWMNIPRQAVPGCLIGSPALEDQTRGWPHSTISSPPASSPSWDWSSTWCTPPWARRCRARWGRAWAPAWSRACKFSGVQGSTAPWERPARRSAPCRSTPRDPP